MLVLVAAGVGAYALANPNGIEFGAPWPAMAEALAAVAAVVLGGGMMAGRRGEGNGVRLVGVILAIAALLALTFVAFALSFNQA